MNDPYLVALITGALLILNTWLVNRAATKNAQQQFHLEQRERFNYQKQVEVLGKIYASIAKPIFAISMSTIVFDGEENSDGETSPTSSEPKIDTDAVQTVKEQLSILMYKSYPYFLENVLYIGDEKLKDTLDGIYQEVWAGHIVLRLIEKEDNGTYEGKIEAAKNLQSLFNEEIPQKLDLVKKLARDIIEGNT